MYFEIISEIENTETIAIGGKIRDIMRIRKQYGLGHWRQTKGIDKVLWGKRMEQINSG